METQARGLPFTPPYPVRLVAWELTGPENRRELEPMIILGGPLFASVMDQVNRRPDHSLEQWLLEAMQAKLAPIGPFNDLETVHAQVHALFRMLVAAVKEAGEVGPPSAHAELGLLELVAQTEQRLEAAHAAVVALHRGQGNTGEGGAA